MTDVTDHYSSEAITERILGALAEAGIDRDDVDADVLGTVDEFHLGGRAASAQIVEVLRGIGPRSLLDIGSGIGGFARLAARALGCSVTGVDLTPAFVATAAELTAIVGREDSVAFEVGSATDLDLDDESVDAITMLHVGMNVADKAAMAAEFARVLRPDGTMVIYDVMRTGQGEITFPMPWASTIDASFVETPDHYRTTLAAAGLRVADTVDLTDLVLDVLASSAEAPRPPVHLGHLMGSGFPTMIANLTTALRGGIVAPTMVVAQRPSS